MRIQIVHFGSIYAQKDSFAHRYGFFEICGSAPLDLGLFGPVARSRRALYLRRAAGGCFGGHGKLTSGAGAGLLGRWSAGCSLRAAWLRALALVCWPDGLRALGAAFVCFRGDDRFFIPCLAWRPGR